jgi:Tfp pilus assembly protein PilX
MNTHPGKRERENGSAILVVMALLFVLTLLVLANTETLRHLQQELRLIDQQQQQKYEPRQGH